MYHLRVLLMSLMSFALLQGILLAWYIGDEGVWVCVSISLLAD
jgi:hypothetical protein